MSSIFGPDHSMVRWLGAIVPVWCTFPAHRHRSFYCCIFYFITNHKIASGNSILKWTLKDCRFFGRKGIEEESERPAENVWIDTDDNFLKEI